VQFGAGPIRFLRLQPDLRSRLVANLVQDVANVSHPEDRAPAAWEG
jgi:hypothetical protein